MEILGGHKKAGRPFAKRIMSDGSSASSRQNNKSHVDKNLNRNIETLKDTFKDCEDVIFRSIRAAGRLPIELVFMDGMIKLDLVDDYIIKPLLLEHHVADIVDKSTAEAWRYIKESIISTSNIKESNDWEEILYSIMIGCAVLFLDGCESVFIIDVKGWEHRQVEQPGTEVTVRGPKDAFTENLRTNTALVRRRIRDPRLKLKSYFIGRRSKTQVTLMYIEDIVNPELVEEVCRRLNGIDIDSVAESGFIEQMIEDDWISPFPQTKPTERPDVVAASLVEGKVSIFTDNTPYVLILPATMNDLLISPDDYYERWMVTTLIRFVRLTGAVTSTILPAVYIAMISYHPEMIPFTLATSIAVDRNGVPFPAFIEAFLMEGVFELMREAGIRLPGSLGQTVGVVGAVVIGQAAVAAGVVSPAMVVVVALTGIANFAVPSFHVALSYRLLRFGLMILSTIFGLYGIILGLLLILSHLSILKSFGTPYMAPWIPLRLRDLKDTLLRAPWQSMRQRPSFMDTKNDTRMDIEKEKNRP